MLCCPHLSHRPLSKIKLKKITVRKAPNFVQIVFFYVWKMHPNCLLLAALKQTNKQTNKCKKIIFFQPTNPTFQKFHLRVTQQCFFFFFFLFFVFPPNKETSLWLNLSVKFSPDPWICEANVRGGFGGGAPGACPVYFLQGGCLTLCGYPGQIECTKSCNWLWKFHFFCDSEGAHPPQTPPVPCPHRSQSSVSP